MHDVNHVSAHGSSVSRSGTRDTSAADPEVESWVKERDVPEKKRRYCESSGFHIGDARSFS